jgi:hypothetical protein
MEREETIHAKAVSFIARDHAQYSAKASDNGLATTANRAIYKN